MFKIYIKATLIMSIIGLSNVFAVVVNDPENHAYHSYYNTFAIIGDEFPEHTSYSPYLPEIPNNSIIDELYFKLKFDDSIAPDVIRIKSISSCDNKQVFNSLDLERFHYSVENNNLILSYNYIDEFFDQSIGGQNRVYDTNCWKILTFGDYINGIKVNITYHQEPTNISTSGLRNYFSSDGYIDTSGSFNGVGTLSVINQAQLDQEKDCEEVSGIKINSDNKKSENLVILIHGWNPAAPLRPENEYSVNKFAPSIGNITECLSSKRPPQIPSNDLSYSWYSVYNNLINDTKVNSDWTVARYDWSEDAATGFIDLSNDDFNKANEARDRSHVHGLRLGKIIKEIQPKQVQFIAHSAGTWMARRAADYLSHYFGDNIKLELTMLDAFVNDNDPSGVSIDLDLESDFALSSNWVPRSRNYYVDDIGTDLLGYTSGEYENWINLQLDDSCLLGSCAGGSAFNPTFMDDHSGPVYWYANTISMGGSHGFGSSLPYAHSLIRPIIEFREPDSQVISVDSIFKLFFSKNMNVSTLAGAISITGSVSGSHSVSGLNYIESDFAVSFGANGDFTPDETVTVSISTSATDRNNNNLIGNNLSKVYEVEGSVVQPPAPPANAMVFVSETIADGTYFNGGDGFTKTWTLKNTGTNTWNSNYCLKHYNGDNLGDNSSVCVSGTVPTNQNYTFSVPMTAPASVSSTTLYRDNWRLYEGNNSFSSSIWAEINVRGLAAPAFNTALALDANNIYLAWSALSDTNYYRLYKSNSFSGNYSEIMAAASSEYTDSGLMGDTNYYYKIKGCFDSQASTCSGLSTAVSVKTFPEAGTASELIQNYSVSDLSVEPTDNITLTSMLYNPSGVAHLNTFRQVYAVSDDNMLGTGDNILYDSESFVLANLQSQSFSYNYTIPDSMTSGGYYLLACVIYDPIGSDSITSYCKSKSLQVSASPPNAPPIPNKPTIDYTQGASQLTVSWNFGSGGVYYRLFRSTSSGGSYNEIYVGSGYSHIDNNIANGSNYYYKLKSCANSLENSCSALSNYRSVSTTSTAANDFSLNRLELSPASNSQFTMEVRQQYSGTSTSLLYPLVGFYLSSDTNCDANSDHFLGEKQSGLNINDTIDKEEITFAMPAFTNTGTWYGCAIADYTNSFTETNEGNNTEFITAVTEVSAPRLTSHHTYIEVEWDSVPNNVSYRLARSTSPDGPFDDGWTYIGTGLSHVDHSLGNCNTYYYQLQSCNGTTSNATCSNSPVISGYTLLQTSPEPTVTTLSDKKVLVEWSDSECADYFLIRRSNDSDSKYIYRGTDTSFIDFNGVLPNTEQSYLLIQCQHEFGLFDTQNGCSYGSNYVSTTTFASAPANENWISNIVNDNLSKRSGAGHLNFKNKLWIIGGIDNSVYKNDIWSSDDGINWQQRVQNAPFSPRYLIYMAEFNGKAYLFGGRDENDNYVNEIWSSSDGINWNLENSEANFTRRSGNPVFISFQGKLWVFGGIDRTAADGSFGGGLDDIWSSTDGVSWVLENPMASYGERYDFQMIIHDNKLILIGGENDPQYTPGTGMYSDIWSSTNGKDWQLVNDNAAFGVRFNHQVVKFNQEYWLIGGKTRVVYEEDPDYDTDTWETRYTVPNENDVWKSTNGMQWIKVEEFTNMPRSGITLNNYNNNLMLFGGGASSVWAANYGYIPTPPNGNIIIQGSPTNNQSLTADSSGISDQYTIGEYTYQWYINGEKIDGEEAVDFNIGSLQVGTEISVRARYTNSNGDLQTLMSESVYVAPNPIAVSFNVSSIDTVYRDTPLTNTLVDFEENYTVIYSSSNTNVATVSGTDETASVSIMGIGTTIISALVTDSNDVQASASFELTVNQAEQQIDFSASVISLDLIDEDFILDFTLTGSSSSDTLFSSSNGNVATIDANGFVQLQGAGTTFISVSNAGDANHLPVSATITLQITDNFIVFENSFE